MRRIILDTAHVVDEASFFREFALQASLPDYFGRNLDALFDFLTTDLPGPVEIVWKKPAIMRVDRDALLAPLRQVCRDAALERPDLKFTEG